MSSTLRKSRDTPYAAFTDDELTLRDLLAVDRTALANERTLLGYLRTSLGVLLAGGSLIQFFQTPWLNWLGWLLVGVSPTFLLVGFWHFRKLRSALAPLMHRSPMS
jgi:putative membrane protein